MCTDYGHPMKAYIEEIWKFGPMWQTKYALNSQLQANDDEVENWRLSSFLLAVHMFYVVNNHLNNLYVLSNKAVGPGEKSKINKCRAYVYLGG